MEHEPHRRAFQPLGGRVGTALPHTRLACLLRLSHPAASRLREGLRGTGCFGGQWAQAGQPLAQQGSV